MNADEDLAREAGAISDAQVTLLRAAISNSDQACFNACKTVFDWMEQASKVLAGRASAVQGAEPPGGFPTDDPTFQSPEFRAALEEARAQRDAELVEEWRRYRRSARRPGVEDVARLIEQAISQGVAPIKPYERTVAKHAARVILALFGEASDEAS